jgi:hypothetical protein
MNLFESLAQKVETAWGLNGHSLESFPEIATRALREFEYGMDQAALEQTLAEWFQQTRPLPPQINVHNTFGQPPITIFNNHKFVVDIYFWLTADTSIHSHGFRGAFRVLHGRSLHEEFTVKTLQEFAPDVHLTDLGIPQKTFLTAGDTMPILPGKDLTHRVVHLEKPTVTLCVKTINEESLHQWNYFPNGLAIQKRHVPAGLIKQIYYFQYLGGQNPDLATKFLEDLLDQCDLSLQMNLAEEISGGAYDLGEDFAGFIMDRIQDRHQDAAWFQRYQELAGLPEAFDEII